MRSPGLALLAICATDIFSLVLTLEIVHVKRLLASRLKPVLEVSSLAQSLSQPQFTGFRNSSSSLATQSAESRHNKQLPGSTRLTDTNVIASEPRDSLTAWNSYSIGHEPQLVSQQWKKESFLGEAQRQHSPTHASLPSSTFETFFPTSLTASVASAKSQHTESSIGIGEGRGALPTARATLPLNNLLSSNLASSNDWRRQPACTASWRSYLAQQSITSLTTVISIISVGPLQGYSVKTTIRPLELEDGCCGTCVVRTASAQLLHAEVNEGRNGCNYIINPQSPSATRTAKLTDDRSAESPRGNLRLSRFL